MLKNLHFSKRQSFVLIIILFFSMVLFLNFVSKNATVNYYDEIGYIDLALQINEKGLFNIESEVRTYLYPLIIAIFNKISFGDLHLTKIFVSIFQYVVFLSLIFYLANVATKNLEKENRKKYILFIVGIAALNPYLIQATSLFLTDILATCFMVLAIIIVSTQNVKNFSVIFLSILSIFIAIMIRPSSLIFLPMVGLIYLLRIITNSGNVKEKVKYVVFSLISMILASIVFIPQIYMNITKFNDFTPLIHMELYGAQSTWATQFLKYGTVVIPDEVPSLYYLSPLGISEGTTMSNLLTQNFMAFIFIFGMHIFGLFDWGYVDSYISDFYAKSRVLGSIFLYVSWLLIFNGMYNILKQKVNVSIKEAKIWGILSSALLYTIFLATTAVESRFGYPIFILLTPFIAYGMVGFKITFKKIIFSAMIILILFILSFWIDLQTGRINWFII